MVFKKTIMLVLILFSMFTISVNCNDSEEMSKYLKIKVKPEKKVYRYGEKIVIYTELENKYKDKSIVIDIQPFYFLVSGSKSSDVLTFYHKEKWINLFLLGEKKKGGVRSGHADGFTSLLYCDMSIPFELILKPNGKIIEKIILEPDLYDDYTIEGEWELQVWQAWEINKAIVRRNTLRKGCLDKKWKWVEDHIEDNEIIMIPIVRNFKPSFRDIPKEDKIKYLLRRHKKNILISEKMTVIVNKK
jgi:hypothetical protein